MADPTKREWVRALVQNEVRAQKSETVTIEVRDYLLG